MTLKTNYFGKLIAIAIKMLKESVVFCAILAVTLAAVGIGPLEPKPEKFKDVEGCYIKDLDEVIPFGKSAPSKTSCMEYQCYTDSIGYESCGAIGAMPPCRVVEDNSKPYPECCGHIVCP